MTIEVDRSRIIAYQRCPRERYLAYHHLGKGLQRKAKSLPLQVGSAFHEGAECLLEGDIETACYRAIKYLADAFKGKGVGFDGEEATDQSLVYSAQEQVALAEALIRAWGLEKLTEFLQTFEVIEVEKEGRANLTNNRNHRENLIDSGLHQESFAGLDDDLVLMFRPDALVRERLSGDLYVVSWKTASMYGKRTLQQCRTDMQNMSEVWGWQEQHLQEFYEKYKDGLPAFVPARVEGVLYLFCVKGKRQLDDWDNQWKQNSHLIYGWKKLKPIDEFDDGWSWTFKYPKEDGSGGSTLGKGWKKVPIWSEYPGGVKQWITDLHERKVFPRHIDPFESVFPQSLPVERRADEVESWKRQVVAQEIEIPQLLKEVEMAREISPESQKEVLDECFPQYSHSCHSYSGCSMIDICWNGVAAEPGELYQIRSANHPETGDEDE